MQKRIWTYWYRNDKNLHWRMKRNFEILNISEQQRNRNYLNQIIKTIIARPIRATVTLSSQATIEFKYIAKKTQLGLGMRVNALLSSISCCLLLSLKHIQNYIFQSLHLDAWCANKLSIIILGSRLKIFLPLGWCCPCQEMLGSNTKFCKIKDN